MWDATGQRARLCDLVSHYQSLLGVETMRMVFNKLRTALYQDTPDADYANARDNLARAEHCLSASVSKPRPMAQRSTSQPLQVAKIELLQLDADSETKNRIDDQLCEQLSFSIWDKVPLAHKPLGRVNRMRWYAYRASAAARKYGVPKEKQ